MKSCYIPGGSGARLYLQEEGNPKGRPILFIHGFTQSHLCWKKQMESSLEKDFRLVTFDLRGHGLSEKPVGGYDLSMNWADDVQAVIEELDLQNPILVAWSLGGVAAGDYIRHYSDSFIGGINFVSASTSLGTKKALELSTPERQSLNVGLASEFTEESVEGLSRYIDLSFYDTPPVEDFYFMLGFNSIVPPFVRQLLLSRKVNNEDVLLKIKKPVLITHGQDDRIIRVEAAQYIKGFIPHARVSIYPDAGHLLFWENSRRFNSELRKFVGSV